MRTGTTRLGSMMRLAGPVLALAVAGAAGVVAGCSSGERAATTTTRAPASSSISTTTSRLPRTRQPDESEGAFVFRTQCAACHGAEAQGNLGPSLVGIADRMSEDQQLEKVRTGGGFMPAFGSSLTEEQIKAVVEYTRTELH